MIDRDAVHSVHYADDHWPDPFQTSQMNRYLLPLLLLSFAVSCSDGTEKLKVAGIPDQGASRLTQQYELLVEYLSEVLEVEVEYVPTTNYAATVTGFINDDIQLAWFGGLTGVQARRQLPDAEAFAQRPEDQEFRSVFIVGASIEENRDVTRLHQLAGLRFTFGSENSTSGHLMPRHFMLAAGVDPESDLAGPPGYSGSHDKTWKLVESGTFEAGVLSEAVWDRVVHEGSVDLAKVREFHRTSSYYDYNWTLRPDIDSRFGVGFSDRLRTAVLGIEDPLILDLFNTDRFIETDNGNYKVILSVAEALGIIE